MQQSNPSPRARILDLLQRRQEVTIKELVEFLGLAQVTVRHHIHRLERDGVVVYRERRRPVGRPDYVFYLSSQGQEAQPKGYDRLAAMLVAAAQDVQAEELSQVGGEGILAALLKRAADDRAAALRQQVSGLDLASRLQGLVSVLNAEHFVAEAGPSDGGFQLRCNACPYLAVAKERPAVCDLDQRLFQDVLQVELTRTMSIIDGDDYCLYEISEPRLGQEANHASSKAREESIDGVASQAFAPKPGGAAALSTAGRGARRAPTARARPLPGLTVAVFGSG